MAKYLSLIALASTAFAGFIPTELVSRDAPTIEERDTTCTNGPSTRQCWSDGYSIATDFDEKWPTTGNTVTYDFELTNTTCNPDGHGDKTCFLFNNQYPGPTIVANWGDMVVVNVKNSLQNNGTTIHFHGIRQFETNDADGVPGVTQCPIAPGSSYQYQFLATQHGTSWYHSHFSSQYGMGAVGSIVINGPASADYDVDLGAYPVSDLYYPSVYDMADDASNNLPNSGPPAPNNIVVNGTSKALLSGGQYNRVTVTKGKKYRLRLINMSVDNYIKVSLDQHQLQIITSDFIPIQPITVSTLLVAIGQRYDVIIDANQAQSSYWFRANADALCKSSNDNGGLAVWTYEGSLVTEYPLSVVNPDVTTACAEPSPLTPYWDESVSSSQFISTIETLNLDITQAQVTPDGGSVTVWGLNTSSLLVDWSKPTLSYVMEGSSDFPSRLNVYEMNKDTQWNYWVITNTASGLPPLPHPIHLHGHDFFVLGTGTGAFTTNSSDLNFANPTRRDTTNLPNGGWLALAFRSGNPGAWLMHCHIAWHVAEGFGNQFLEDPSSISVSGSNLDQYNSTCQAWDSYAKSMVYEQNDSGV